MIAQFFAWLKSLFAPKPVSPAVIVVPPAPHNPEAHPESPAALKIGASGLTLIRHFEGCYLHAYQDSVGVWTIGWGRIKYDDGSPVKQGDSCDQAAADRWLLEDIEKDGSQYVRGWAARAKVPLTQDQFDALSSFTYNRGAGRFSQLVAMPGAIFDNILAFDFAGPKKEVLPGLTRRRWAERAMFLHQDWTVFLGGDWRKFAHK